MASWPAATTGGRASAPSPIPQPTSCCPWWFSSPWWLLGIVVGRDLVIVFGAMAYRQVLGNFDVQPTLLSKVNTGLQVVMLLLVVVGLADFGLVSSVAATVVDPSGFVVVGVSAVASGLHYVVVWSLRAASGIRERREEA